MNRRNKKGISFLLLITLVLLVPACGNEQVNLVKSETAAKEESQPQEETQEAESIEDKTERLNRTEFENLSQAAEQEGFSFRALDKFSNGYYFSRFSITEEQDEDENGQKIGEAYKAVSIKYLNADNNYDMTVKVYSKAGELTQPPTFVSTEKIGGIEVSMTEYLLKLVDQDYILTEEEKEWSMSGKGSFSCDGVTVGEVYFRGAYWQEDGLYYELQAGSTMDMPLEEVKTMAEELINAGNSSAIQRREV